MTTKQYACNVAVYHMPYNIACVVLLVLLIALSMLLLLYNDELI
jgi:hypothetical protein